MWFMPLLSAVISNNILCIEYFGVCNIIVLSANYRLLKRFHSFILLTESTKYVAHTLGAVVAGSDKHSCQIK